MTALWIILAVCAFIALIMLIPVGIDLRYDGNIAAAIRVLFIRYQLYPKKQKKINLRKFSKKRFDRMLAKQAEKEEKKKAKKAKKAAVSAEKKAEKKEKPTEDEHSLVKDLWEMRSLILDTVGFFIHRIHTTLARIRVTIGAEDAAKCAILYGAVAQSAAYITEILRTQTILRKKEEVDIRADFTSEKTVADVDVRFAVRIGGVVLTVLHLGIGFIKKQLKKD